MSYTHADIASLHGLFRSLEIMVKAATLSGVAHDIAHHSASGLSYLSPHLTEALRGAGATTTEIDLLQPSPYPDHIAELKPLRSALSALHQTVMAMLTKHGFHLDDVISIKLQATPAPWDKTGYVLHTRTIIEAANGRMYDSGWLQ